MHLHIGAFCFLSCVECSRLHSRKISDNECSIVWERTKRMTELLGQDAEYEIIQGYSGKIRTIILPLILYFKEKYFKRNAKIRVIFMILTFV